MGISVTLNSTSLFSPALWIKNQITDPTLKPAIVTWDSQSIAKSNDIRSKTTCSLTSKVKNQWDWRACMEAKPREMSPNGTRSRRCVCVCDFLCYRHCTAPLVCSEDREVRKWIDGCKTENSFLLLPTRPADCWIKCDEGRYEKINQ